MRHRPVPRAGSLFRERLRALTAASAVLVALTGCGAGTAGTATTTSTVTRGGTLRVVDPAPPQFPGSPDATTFDMDVGGSPDGAELMRCCLGRTLLSYSGQPTAKGGAELLPDLATAAPDVSPDGLQWTFHLRAGLHYGPPLQDTEIVSTDIVRALERSARVGQNWLPILSVIRGYADYAQGKTSSIAGLEVPDVHTLVVRLTQPAGDLGYRLSTAPAVPIPPLAGHPEAAYGVETGHDAGDGAFLVSSGPYMIEGSEAIDFRLPPDQQKGARGFVSGHSLTLVRNPSWSAAADSLRPALSDRIEIDFTLNEQQGADAIDAGRADILVNTGPLEAALEPWMRAYQNDPARGRVNVEDRDDVRFLSMNLAVPPLDDVHVRRAIAWLLDKPALRDAFAGPLAGAPTGHLAPDSLEAGGLLTFDPFRAADSAARLAQARQEMARSRYDSTHSGTCDASVCRHVALLSRARPHQPGSLGAIVQADLAPIGIAIDAHDADGKEFFGPLGDPASRTPMAVGWGWGNDYPSSSDFFVFQFTAQGIGNGNASLVGVSADQLRGWGYSVTSVPNIDDRVAACSALIGGAQVRCWTALDQYLSEQVVPFVPLYAGSYIEVIPARVTQYSFDQAFDLPALDHIAVAR